MTSVEEKRTALSNSLKINKTNDFIAPPQKDAEKVEFPTVFTGLYQILSFFGGG